MGLTAPVDASAAGEATRPPLVVRDTDTIDASNIPTDLLGHGYIASSQAILDDLVLLLQRKQSPPRGKLRPVKVASLEYWRLH